MPTEGNEGICRDHKGKYEIESRSCSPYTPHVKILLLFDSSTQLRPERKDEEPSCLPNWTIPTRFTGFVLGNRGSYRRRENLLFPSTGNQIVFFAISLKLQLEGASRSLSPLRLNRMYVLTTWCFLSLFYSTALSRSTYR